MISKTLKLCLLLLLVCCVVASGQNRTWQSSNYKGLLLGKSTKADVERTFGKPIWEGYPEDENDIPVENMLAYTYENVAGFNGYTRIWMKRRSGVITDIILAPSDKRPISMETAIDMYGRDYIERDMDLGSCPTSKELRNFKRTQERNYPIFLVYPQKGMYVSIRSDNTVQEIVYANKCP